MKYIYAWNKDKNMYSVRMASKEEENKINDAIKLFEQCKREYYRIIDSANKEYSGDIDLFIDNEAYSTVQHLHQTLNQVEEMTKGLIKLDISKYCFLTW